LENLDRRDDSVGNGCPCEV